MPVILGCVPTLEFSCGAAGLEPGRRCGEPAPLRQL